MTTRMEADLGVQVTLPCEERSAQTTWHRAVNAAVQYEPISFASKASTGTGDDEDNRPTHNPMQAAEHELMSNRREFLQFLESASYLVCVSAWLCDCRAVWHN
jgi:hypothetical protein